MQLTIDLVLVGIFALLVVIGWWRGFLKTVLSLGRLILSFLITILLGPAVSAWIDEAFVNPPVYESVHEKFTALANEAAATAQGGVDALIQKIPSTFQGYLDLENVDPSSDIHALADEWSVTVAGGISKVIATVIGYILLFVVAFILLTVAIFIIGKIADSIKLVHTVDKLLGLALGVISGCIAVLLISTVLGAILSVTGQEAVVEESFMLKLSAGIRDMIFNKG